MSLLRRDRAVDALALVALKLAIGAWVLHAGFTHVSDDDYARTVIAERFAHGPRLDPSGTSWLPLPFWVEGLAMMAFGTKLATARTVALTLGAACTVAPYLAMRQVGMHRVAALAAAVLASTLPWNAWLGAATVPEGWAGSLVGAAVIAMPDDRARPWAAVGLAVGALSRYETWPACAAMAALCAWRALRGGRLAREAACASVALLGPVAWMAWNAHAHGSAVHFLARVTAFRQAVGAASVPLVDKVLDYPRALVEQAPLAAVLGAVGAAGLAASPQRARWAWPGATALVVLAFLVFGDVHDGAPTHHPARALVAVWWVLVAAGVDAASLAAARLAERSPRGAWVVGAAAGLAALASSVSRWSDAPGRTAYEQREPQIARGLDMRARGVAAARISPCAFEHFALLAAWGEPERATIDARADTPPHRRLPASRRALMSSRDPYDQLPYTAHAYAESHPDRTAVVARLSGWEPPPVETARVLELGCGRGGNLLPMASSLPRGTFVGVDRSARQIEEARALASATSLGSARFEEGAAESLGPLGSFDYVVCHGVCSWVPPATRRGLLATIARSLAPGGVATVSFNVLPGWYERLAARDWLRAFPADDPAQAVTWLRDNAAPELADYRRRLDGVAKRLRETDAAYAAHEYLADEHHPQQVSELLGEARATGLVYLGDAIPAATALELLPEAAASRARGLAADRAQQVVDFVRCTAFRRTLLVRSEDAVARGWTWPPHLDAGALDGMRIASRLRPGPTERSDAPFERFDADGASVQVTLASARRALHGLARAGPRSLAWGDLVSRAGPDDAADLRRELFDLWLATGAIDLHVHEPEIGLASSKQPAACPVARWRAARGGPITNRWHQEVKLEDPILRWVLSRLDGTLPSSELASALRDAPGMDTLDAPARERLAGASLQALASAALLVR